MNTSNFVPRILIIDDLFGRVSPSGPNEERTNLCGQFLLEDVTGDEASRHSTQKIKKPIAQAVFHRGQRPICSKVGDVVDNDIDAVLEIVRRGWMEWRPGSPTWSLVLLDLCFYTGRVTEGSHRRTAGMPEGREGDADPQRYFGLQILQKLQEEFPDLPVVILSSKPRAEVSREFSGYGGLAFLERDGPDSPGLLRDYIQRHGFIPDEAGEIVGYSRNLLRALRTARRAARGRKNILIRGERGTGKELLAKYINRQSLAEKALPLVVVDSGTLSRDLFGSTLFGHRKGAFTGADENRTGAIVEADGGDLVLDEIGNMPPEVQSGLLRVLEYRKVQPIGGSAKEAKTVDVRFLSATNADIEAKASAGTFREDLYDRLREGGVIHLPPLREHPEDIPFLVEQFVRQAEAATPGSLPRSVEAETLALLRNHSWPGNIRELRNCIFNAVAAHPDVEHLVPFHLDVSVDTAKRPKAIQPLGSTHLEPPAAPSGSVVTSVEDIIAKLNAFEFDSMKPRQFAGKLSDLQAAWARFMARFLKAGLEATRKPTPENPEGEILVQPALKLLSGQRELKAWQVYDAIRRISQISPEVMIELQADPVLSKALNRSKRSRGKN